MNKSKPRETVSSSVSQREPKTPDSVLDLNTGDKPHSRPRLSSYYTDPRITAAAFVRAVRATRIIRFDAEDVYQTRTSLDELDPTLARTVGLLGKGPEPVARWVTEITKQTLRQALSGDVSDGYEAANTLFDRVVRMSAEHLAAKDKQRHARAQNLLRLILAWLIEDRNLSPIDALISVRKAKPRKAKSTAVNLNRDAAHLLRRATLKQLIDLSSIAALFETTIAEEAKERRQVFGKFTDLKHRITSLDTELHAKAAELDALKEDRANLTDELSAVQGDLRNEKELRALDRTRQNGRFRRFLAERLKQPLSDALDALEVDPPHVSTARQRIEMAMTAIGHGLEVTHE